MEVLSFVKQLELAPMGEDEMQVALRGKGSALKEQNNQGFVDAGSLVSFTETISCVHKSDVLNSTLLAQLAADHIHNRNIHSEKWYDKYINVLGKLGWVVQDFEFERYEANAQTMKISKTIIDIVQALLTPSEIETVERVLESLQSQGNEPWWDVFDSKSTDPSQNFQVAPCVDDLSGQVVMALASFCFTASSREDRWLCFDYNPTSQIGQLP